MTSSEAAAAIARGLTWARLATDGLWSISAVRPLPGGITGFVTALDMRDAKGRRLRVVLKLYRPDRSEPDSARREANILHRLAATNLPVPRVVAIDQDGGDAGWPALLMTRMPGRRRMRPRELGPPLHELAELARRIHSLALPHDALPRYRPWGLDDPLPVPGWWTDPRIWRRAVEIFHGPVPDEQPVFIHRDFHPGNVLWTGAKPSAIVDWLHGCLGPASVDIAHCRINLWLDIGPQAADGVLNAYRAIRVESPPHNPYWDIADAMSWRIDPVRHGVVRARRYESFVAAAVAALRE